jgi:hypothetical protein
MMSKGPETQPRDAQRHEQDITKIQEFNLCKTTDMLQHRLGKHRITTKTTPHKQIQRRTQIPPRNRQNPLQQNNPIGRLNTASRADTALIVNDAVCFTWKQNLTIKLRGHQPDSVSCCISEPTPLARNCNCSLCQAAPHATLLYHIASSDQKLCKRANRRGLPGEILALKVRLLVQWRHNKEEADRNMYISLFTTCISRCSTSRAC